MNNELKFAGEWTEYDLRLNYFIDKYKFDSSLVFSFKLPYLLPGFNESYCIKVSKNSFDTMQLNKKDRYIAFSGNRQWINNQKTTARYSTISVGSDGNTILTTDIVVAIQINRDELDSIANLFTLQVNDLTKELNVILQNVVEIISYRDNEKSNGKSFMFTTCMDCDRIHCGLYKNYVEKKYLVKQFIIANQPSPTGDSWDETSIDTCDMEKEIESWRYFKNKSNYEYKSNLFLDSIISASISIETFILSKVKSFCSNKEDETQYTSEKVTNENGVTINKFLTITKLIKKLVDEKRLLFSISKAKICDCVEKILTPRNDIMHGKLPVNSSWRCSAEIVNKELANFYSSLVLDNNRIEDEAKNDFSRWEKYQTFIEKHTRNEFVSIEDKLADAEEMCSKYTDLEYPKISKVIGIIELKDYEKAKVLQNEIMFHSSNPEAVAIELYIRYLNHEQFDYAVEILTSPAITHADERIYTALAITYYLRFQKRKNKIDLDNAVLMIEKAMQSSNKYILSFRVARDIYITCNNKMKIATVSKALSQDKENFEFLLFCASFYLNEHMYNDAELALRNFVDSFEKHPYEKYCMDYVVYKNDLSSILQLCLQICTSLINLGRNMGDTMNRIKSFSACTLCGVKRYNNIAAFARNKNNYKSYQVTISLPNLIILGKNGNYIIKK